MGNTQATDAQFTNRYALKTAYDGTVVIVDNLTKQVAAIITAANELATRVTNNRSAYDAFVTATNKTITDNKALYDAYVTATNKTIADNRSAYDTFVTNTNKTITDNKALYDTFVTGTNAKLVAVENKITTEITAANKLSADAIKKVADDLATLGVRVTTIETTFNSKFSALQKDLNEYKLSNNAALNTLQGTYNAFITNLKSNYTFDKINIGNNWFFHNQTFNNVDNLCIGKNIAGTNKILMCLDTSGNLNYSSMNQNSTFGAVPVAVAQPTPVAQPITVAQPTTVAKPTDAPMFSSGGGLIGRIRLAYE